MQKKSLIKSREATSATPAALRAVLPMLGKREEDGSVRVEWRSRR